MDREWDRDLSALDSPLDTDYRGVHIQPLRNFHDDRIFDVNCILGGLIAIRAGRGTDRCKADRCDLMVDTEFEKFRLLKMGMEFHLVCDGLDLCIPQQ